MTTMTTPPAADYRVAFRAFVLAQAEAWHRAHLGRLYVLWDGWNAAYFAGQFVPPYVLLTPPESPGRWATNLAKTYWLFVTFGDHGCNVGDECHRQHCPSALLSQIHRRCDGCQSLQWGRSHPIHQK